MAEARRMAARLLKLLPSWPPSSRDLEKRGLSFALALSVPTFVLVLSQLRELAHRDSVEISAVQHESAKNRRNLRELLVDEALRAQLNPSKFWNAVPSVYAAQLRPVLSQYATAVSKDRPDEPECVPLELAQIMPSLSPVMTLDHSDELAVAGLALAICAAARDLTEGYAKTTAEDPVEKWADGTELVKVVKLAENLWYAAERVACPNSLRSLLWSPVEKIAGWDRRAPKPEACILLRHGLSALDPVLRRALSWARQRKRKRYIAAISLYLRLCGRAELPFVACSGALDILIATLSPLRVALRQQLLNAVVAPTAAAAGAISAGSGVRRAAVAMLKAELCLSMLTLLARKVEDFGATRIMQKLQIKVFEKILEMDVGYFDTHGSRWTNDAMDSAGWDIKELLEMPTQLVSNVARLFATYGVLRRMSGAALTRRALLCIGAPLLFSIASRYLESEATSLMYTVEDATHGDEQWDWWEVVQPRALITMRANSREPKELEKFARGVRSEAKIQSRAGLINSLFESPRELFYEGGRILALWGGARAAAAGEVSFSSLTEFAALSESLLDGVVSLWRKLKHAERSLLGQALLIEDLLSKRPAIGLHGGIVPSAALRGEVVFERVAFSYPSRKGSGIVRDYSLTIEPGAHVGVAGPSGCGKSTLVKLLLRLYDPSSGTIRVDGHALSELNPLWLRRQCALVEQEPVLFAKTVRDNVLFSAEHHLQHLDADQLEARLVAATKRANCYEAFTASKSFPEGFRTIVGEGGANMAGGEKQRLAIARAILREPRLLLLDEPTSALDAESEKLVTEALEALMKGRTTVVIAHRLKTLRNCSKILFLEGGVVAEMGTYDDLVSKPDGRFASYVSKQKLGGCSTDRVESGVSDEGGGALEDGVLDDEEEEEEEDGEEEEGAASAPMISPPLTPERRVLGIPGLLRQNTAPTIMVRPASPVIHAAAVPRFAAAPAPAESDAAISPLSSCAGGGGNATRELWSLVERLVAVADKAGSAGGGHGGGAVTHPHLRRLPLPERGDLLDRLRREVRRLEAASGAGACAACERSGAVGAVARRRAGARFRAAVSTVVAANWEGASPGVPSAQSPSSARAATGDAALGSPGSSGSAN